MDCKIVTKVLPLGTRPALNKHVGILFVVKQPVKSE